MVAFNMIALFSGASAATYTTEAPPAPLSVARMLGGTGLRSRRELRVDNYEFVSALNGKIYECENNNCLDDKLYTSKKAASEACDKNPACGFITCKTRNGYLLRRSSETKTQLCTSCITFSKPQITGLPFIADKPGKLTKNNLVDTVPYVSSEYRVSFDLWVDTIGHWNYKTPKINPENEWQNVLRLKGAESGPGFRIPYLTFHGGNKWLHVCSYVRNNPNSIVRIEKTFPLKQWVKIVIEQKKEGGEYVYKIVVEGLDNRVIKYKDDVNNRDFGNVSVYAGEPGDEPVDGYIRNLSITSADPFTATRNGWSSGCAGGNCINNNLAYTSKEEALGQCLNTHQCDAVMRWINGKFYLRRLEDSIYPRPLATIYTTPKTDRVCPKKLLNREKCDSHCDCQRRCMTNKKCHC